MIGDTFVDIQGQVDTLPSEWNTDTASYKTVLLPGGSAANTARQLHELIKKVPNFEFISWIGAGNSEWDINS